MEDVFFNVSLSDVKRELRRAIIECQKRCLLYNSKWLAELHHGLSDINIDTGENKDNSFQNAQLEGITPEDYSNYFLAKSYFDVREYDRAAHAVRLCESPVPRFLHLYATYMARDKQRLDSTTDQLNLNGASEMRDLSDLLSLLRAEYGRNRLDGYGLYLYGVVLKALNLNQVAQQMLEQAVRSEPLLWSAYLELAPLITEKEKLLSLHLGGHWMRHFFMAHTYLELYLNDEGLKIYEELQTVGFHKCVYLTAQLALAYHNKRDVDKAIEVFQQLQESDPYRLDNMDIYSNLLFVKELKTEMAQLAHKAVSINKYRPETCCVIGNYYSIRCDHQMAISYFQRALKLNPKYLAAWTLMGHEFMELKNTNAAIQSYRKAVEVNKRDYRAWYGLGQAYEILKMHYYSLYYFKIAHHLRPCDSRMLVALGETYEKLDKSENAIKCYWKACDVGDIEGIAMYKLASLHEKLDDNESAVNCYIMYCEDEHAATDKQSLYHGYIKLANYYEVKGEFNRAAYYAYKCLESDDRKNEAKSILKTIEIKRNELLAKTKQETKEKCTTATTSKIATAETSSEDDMDLEMSDLQQGTSSDCISKSAASGTPTTTSSSVTVLTQKKSSKPVTNPNDEASSSRIGAAGADIVASTSVAPASDQATSSSTEAVEARASTSAQAVENSTAPGVNTRFSDDTDETNNANDSNDMEVSTISID